MKFIIEEKAFLKLCYYIKNIDNEIGGLLETRKHGNTIVIEDVLLLEQEVSGTSVELSRKDLGKFIYENRKNPKLLKAIHGWWHSHCDFDIFWSGTDNRTFRHLLQYFGDFVVGIVANKQHKFLFRYDTFDKEGEHIHFETNKFTIFSRKRSEIEAFCKAQIKEKVHERPWINLTGDFYEIFKAIIDVRSGRL